jgi:predicted nucleic acid-binding protein
MTRRVFWDASFWIALRDEKEPEHRRAREVAGQLLAEKTHLLTTFLVFAETHAYFARSPHRARQILDDAEGNPLLQCERVLPADEREAIRVLRQQRDKSYSLCDAVSFVIMRRTGVSRVATYDDHFRQFGEFEVVS